MYLIIFVYKDQPASSASAAFANSPTFSGDDDAADMWTPADVDHLRISAWCNLIMTLIRVSPYELEYSNIDGVNILVEIIKVFISHLTHVSSCHRLLIIVLVTQKNGGNQK